MADEMTEGAMIVIGDDVFLIPRDDLRSFRAPDDVAAAARAQLEDQEAEVAGYQAPRPGVPAVYGVKFGLGLEPLQFSSIMAHGLTASRVC